ncbi:hypothetical protein IP92_00204 [Pseudoduganella flava]|uniref:Uncharacterized protein n=1 Tax=Pseudoduganella flava TaxID=871742 RepID=A0A562Q3B1_9BURK|nr:hypothetical protein [Pseudoduganella flava]QGZ41282.1 hypothetical protein GO485_20930 [Pseudoduganella flava]TWI51221.1 hypothetical protein IP92_00204 [Pseudoduganella flava]
MSEHVFLFTIFMVLAAVLLVFGIRAFSAIAQAKYRARADGESARTLASIDASLVELRERIAAIERILRQVD